MGTNEKQLVISVRDAGRLLGLSKNSAYQACKRGQIPSIRCGGRILVPVAKLEQLLGREIGNPAEAEKQGPRTESV